MVIVGLTGGLGNQLFQYALGRRLALDRGVPLKLDLTTYKLDTYRAYGLGHFAIQAEVASEREVAPFRHPGKLRRIYYRWERQLVPYHRRAIVREARKFHYAPEILRARRHIYLKGYWVTERYFAPIAPLIRNELRLIEAPDAENQAMAERIAAVESVSLHVRRGDYVTDPRANRRHGVLSPDYYRRAVEAIAARVENPYFFVFSDDIPWARENLKLAFPTTFVDHNGPARDYEDLRLISLCRHHIIANSTFSWWGAWLGHNPHKIVIAPASWLRDPTISTPDIYPSDWIRL